MPEGQGPVGGRSQSHGDSTGADGLPAGISQTGQNFLASGGISAAIAEAKELGALVNAAADPEQTDFHVPSRIERGDLLLTVSTGGGSPAFSRLLRERLEQEYPNGFGDFLVRLSRLRQTVKRMPGGSREHERLWRQALTQHVIDLVRAGQLDQAEEEIKNGIINAGAQPQDGTC